MIKVDYKADHEKGLVMFAFEASRPTEYEVLDMLCQVLSQATDAQVGFMNEKRLVAKFKGLVSPTEDAASNYE